MIVPNSTQATAAVICNPAERLDILYTGTFNQFVGPIDFLSEPDGLAAGRLITTIPMTLWRETGYEVCNRFA